jgi:Zn-finger nucleic acid-binding protein
MIRMVALDQHHIWYECCKVCGGVFIDAGEFKDFKEKTVLDSFKDLFTEARK